MSTLDSNIKQWSKTPAANGTAPNTVPYGWPEGMPPSAVNDTARQNMTDHRYQWEDAEWFCRGETVSRVSGSAFKIATDVTATYLANRRIKIFDTSTMYAVVTSSSYSAPDTTINLIFDSGSLTASFSAVALSILSPINLATPPATRGTATNDNAVAGNVGESIVSVIASGAPVTLTTNTDVNITSISLTAGDWDVWGNVGLRAASAGLSTFAGWINTTSATAPDQSLYNNIQISTGLVQPTTSIQVPYKRIALAATTTVYLSARGTFAGTADAIGGIFARRAR